MTPVDAQFYWMSGKLPNDQFLLYVFDGDVDAAEMASVRRRAQQCPDLRIRIQEGVYWKYPKWVAVEGDTSAVEHHRLDASWSDCLAEVVGLAESQVDCRVLPWRMHVFTGVDGVPRCRGAATVVVFQIAHALADGTRAAAVVAWLFGRAGAPPEPPVPVRVRFPTGLIGAVRAQRDLAEDTAQGRVPAPGSARTPVVTNHLPPGPRSIRTLVLRRDGLSGPSVTVAALAAVGAAMRAHFDLPDAHLGAEVPMAKPGKPHARNHFRNVSVGLFADRPWSTRCEAITAELAQRRQRSEHPALQADDVGFAATPAALLRWGIGHFDPNARSATVSGNTVVSSVNRGAADLRFGSAPVVMTAGYPALSPMMGLVHGVHGIGDTVAVSVHAAQAVVCDIDAYVELLRDAFANPSASRSG